MLVCIGQECVMPAKWRPVLVALPQKHWGEMEQRVQLDLCFCDIHRATATLESLFTDAARKGLDCQFIGKRLPPPDWARSKLNFAEITREQQKRSLFTYTVFHSPSDFPGKFVVRKHATGPSETVFPQELVCVEETLDAARAKIPAGCIRFPRAPEDAETIMEVWL